jgi:hypothetical protein
MDCCTRELIHRDCGLYSPKNWGIAALAILCLFHIISCGASGSVSSKSPPPVAVSSVSVNPSSAQVYTGQNQSFTAQVTGTGTYSSAVTWSVNGVTGGNSSEGTISSNGEYTAPATPPNPNNITIAATSVQTPTVFGVAIANVVAPTVFASITPSSASAGESVVIDIENGYDTMSVVFPAANGTTITLPLILTSGNGFTIDVPFGATSGNVYITATTLQGTAISTNSLPFTRLPNLLVHAPTKDLSSGETLQLDWRLLGASTPNVITWTADSGSISAQGSYQAPVVSSESYAHVTGCVQQTNSCNTVLLRVLPFRIVPDDPIVNVGDAVQLSAIQGQSTLSPQWSVLAGGGSISAGGLFTAPTVAAQAGAVPISATTGSTTEQSSVTVSGAFPGLVNRVYDYANFNTFTPAEATFTESVAVSGNRAYAVTSGNPYHLTAAYRAIDVYDITNPDQPVWIDAGESAANSNQIFANGDTLFSLGLAPNSLATYSLDTQVPMLTAINPLPSLSDWIFNNGVLYVIEYQVDYTGTVPVDTYTMSAGTAIQNHYVLPLPANVAEIQYIAVNGNYLYGSYGGSPNNNPQYTILTYDISQSPPALVSTLTSPAVNGIGVFLYATSTLLFANSDIYDISNGTPTKVSTIPVTFLSVWGVEGNSVLATGGSSIYWGGSANYVVVDISSPSNPKVEANVVDLTTWDVFNPVDAVWASNGRFYAADGAGGIAVYDASVKGGPASSNVQQEFDYVYDQQVQGETLYVTALYGSGAGGLGCYDLSSGTPTLVGTLMYSNDTSYALQVSGTTVFLGMADSLKVIDASNPQSPTELASVSVPVITLTLSGNTLFAGTSDGRLVVFDVSNPASPTQLASLTMPASSTMRVSGTLLLVAAGQSGLLTFNVSNPSSPALLSQFSPSPSAPVWDVVPLQGSVVAFAADASGMVTVDLSTPSNPQQIYQQPLPYLNPFPAPSSAAGIIPAFSLAAQNGVTYVGTTAGILFSYDTTTPSNPRLVGFNVVGQDDLDYVAVITPAGNDLYLSVEGMTMQLDNTVPQNSIELYFPPAALSYAIQITGGVVHSGASRNPAVGESHGSLTGSGRSHDRFGVLR